MTALESSQAILNRIASEQLVRLRDWEHNITMLLGVTSSQGGDIKEMKSDVNSIKERLERVESRLDSIDQRLETFGRQLHTIIALLSGKSPTPPEQ